ncbi:MAG: hypothetical protein ACP5NV_04440 [Candidatus Woesearchaeota archaeon]
MPFQQEQNKYVNLIQLNNNIESALDSSIDIINQTTKLRLSRGKLTDFLDSKDRNYAMKTSCNVNGLSVPDTTLTLVVFEPGDGTGNQSNYVIAGVEPKYTPRDKTGVAELFIPIGTFYFGRFIPFLNSLEGNSIENTGTVSDYNIYNYATFGLNKEQFNSAINSVTAQKDVKFTIDFKQLTFAADYGNPHAIYFDNKTGTNKRLRKNSPTPLIQIAGFLPILKEEDFWSIQKYHAAGSKKSFNYSKGELKQV